MAPPVQSAFAWTVARTAVASEISATTAGAATIATAIPIAIPIAGAATEVATATSTPLAAVRAFASVFTAGLLGSSGWNKDGLIRDTEERGDFTFHRSPEANRCLDRDDDGLDLDARTVFTTRAVFTTRTTVAFGARTTVTYTARTTIAFGARFTTRAVALRDAGLAAFFGGAFGAAFTRFAAGTRLAFGARFTTFTRFTLLALFRGVLLGEGTGEVLGQLRRIFDDATGWAGGLTIGGRRSGATRRTTATELLRRRDGTGLGGGFGRGPDH